MENATIEPTEDGQPIKFWDELDKENSTVNAYVSDMLYGIDKFMKRNEPHIAKLYVRGIITYLTKYEKELAAANTTGITTHNLIKVSLPDISK